MSEQPRDPNTAQPAAEAEPRPYEQPDDPGNGSGVIPQLDPGLLLDASTAHSEDADSINVDEADEDTDTSGE